MTTPREIRESELNFNQYGGDGEDNFIDWDGERIPGVVSDVEAKDGPLDAGLERKMVSVRKADIHVQPGIEDEIQLNLDPDKVDDGDYWRVEKVRDLDLEYDVFFYRYVS